MRTFARDTNASDAAMNAFTYALSVSFGDGEIACPFRSNMAPLGLAVPAVRTILSLRVGLLNSAPGLSRANWSLFYNVAHFAN